MERFFVVVPFMNFNGSAKKVDAFNHFINKLVQCIKRTSIIIVECVLEGKQFKVTQASNPCHVQLKTKSIMHLKENLINIGVSKLPPDWKYVAWIDSGTELLNPQWNQDAIKVLRKQNIVQLFDEYVVVDGKGKVLNEKAGFVKRNVVRTLRRPSDTKLIATMAGENSTRSNGGLKSFVDLALCKGIGDNEGQPGVAWATTHKTWELLDGLLEAAIGGGGEIYMAYSLIGQLKRCGLPILSAKYKQKILEWDSRAAVIVQSYVGFVKGVARKNKDDEETDESIINGEKILNENSFDPYKDLKRNLQRMQLYVDIQSPLAVTLSEHIMQQAKAIP